jgi:hypothetical protein
MPGGIDHLGGHSSAEDRMSGDTLEIVDTTNQKPQLLQDSIF